MEHDYTASSPAHRDPLLSVGPKCFITVWNSTTYRLEASVQTCEPMGEILHSYHHIESKLNIMVDTFQVPALPRMFRSIRMLFLLHHPGDTLLPKLCSVWSNFEKSLSCITYMLYSNYFPGSFLGKNPSFPLRSPPFPLHPGQCLVVMGCQELTCPLILWDPLAGIS